MSKKTDDEKNDRAVVLCRLLAFFITKDIELQKDKIVILNRMGLSNKEIATVLGINSGTVTNALK